MPKKNTSVTLDKGEQEVCKLIAKLRHAEARKVGIKNSKVGSQSNYSTDLEGIGGELALCKILNVFPYFSVFVRKTKEDKGDVIFKGKSIDVKTTKYDNGKLISPFWKKDSINNIDVYVLMTGTFPNYVYRGYMHSKDFIKKERLGNLGYGDTYIAEQDELK